MGKTTGVAKEQRRALDRLKSVQGIERFYLAGGTAIAVHLRHRTSIDLDLFSTSADVDLSVVAEAIRIVVADLQVLSVTEAALRIRVAGVPVDVVRYPYAPLETPMPGPESFPMASLRDLATMKLAAIARRGLRRDFWDLHAIAEAGLSLQETSVAYIEKYGVSDADLYHVLRALTYFEDAEKDPVYPRGLTPAKWERIKTFFLTEAPKVLLGE
ncbi:MAG: nucleotidyl transferase AbiEii/AbiGii toxin family protein [Byssovorax sp.]